MPFMAKCVTCGYVLWANTSAFLKMLMEQHDSESHRVTDSADYDFCSWVITKINSYAYAQICMASKNPSFWKALRTSPKTL